MENLPQAGVNLVVILSEMSSKGGESKVLPLPMNGTSSLELFG
ncbi:hypothetical protein RintRC_1834 [Richelia intracellularis]|nr:hypothetical protein RintRC_1834 [Richelia intracellularis]